MSELFTPLKILHCHASIVFFMVTADLEKIDTISNFRCQLEFWNLLFRKCTFKQINGHRPCINEESVVVLHLSLGTHEPVLTSLNF